MILIMENPEKILDAFRWAVAEMGMKQEDVGRVLGLKQAAVSLLLSGQRAVKQVHIKKMAEELGITPHELIEKSEAWHRATAPQTPPSTSPDKTESSGGYIKIPTYDEPYRQDHHKKIEEFPDQKLALELNSYAVELAKLNPRALEDTIKHIKYQIFEESKNLKKQETPKANGTRGE